MTRIDDYARGYKTGRESMKQEILNWIKNEDKRTPPIMVKAWLNHLKQFLNSQSPDNSNSVVATEQTSHNTQINPSSTSGRRIEKSGDTSNSANDLKCKCGHKRSIHLNRFHEYDDCLGCPCSSFEAKE